MSRGHGEMEEEGIHARARRLFLLAARLKPDPATLDELMRGAWASQIWEAAAAIARRVSQEPLLHDFVARHAPGAPLSDKTRSDLENQTRFQAFRWTEIREVLEEILEVLGTEGIRPVLLKGISLVGECYQPPHLRPMRDIDLLLRAGDVHAG